MTNTTIIDFLNKLKPKKMQPFSSLDLSDVHNEKKKIGNILSKHVNLGSTIGLAYIIIDDTMYQNRLNLEPT